MTLHQPNDDDRARTPGRQRRLTRRQVLAGAVVAAAAGSALAARALDVEPSPRLSELVERCRFGAYADNEPWPVDPHFALEAALGARLPVSSWFQDFGGVWPQSAARTLAARGSYDIVMCWESHGVAFADILDGSYDTYIRDYVEAASAHPGEVVLRPFHESNGNWYDWAPASGRGYCDGPEQWQQAWRHVVTVGRSTGAENVKFFWCMNSEDVGDVSLEELWPGGEHVDYVGVDAYQRRGTSFPPVLEDSYGRITRLDSEHDFWLGEIGVETTAVQDVAAAYDSVYTTRAFPRLKTALWFHKDNWQLTPSADAVDVHSRHLPRMPE